jgi:hypothetical protein
MFPKDLAGKDAIELGCGTAYVSAWLAQQGARVVGIENSAAQLGTARRLQRCKGRHSFVFLFIRVNRGRGRFLLFDFFHRVWHNERVVARNPCGVFFAYALPSLALPRTRYAEIIKESGRWVTTWAGKITKLLRSPDRSYKLNPRVLDALVRVARLCRLPLVYSVENAHPRRGET